MTSGGAPLVLLWGAILLLAGAGGLGLALSRQARLASFGARPVVWFRYLRVAGWIVPIGAVAWVVFLLEVGTAPRPSVSRRSAASARGRRP